MAFLDMGMPLPAALPPFPLLPLPLDGPAAAEVGDERLTGMPGRDPGRFWLGLLWSHLREEFAGGWGELPSRGRRNGRQEAQRACLRGHRWPFQGHVRFSGTLGSAAAPTVGVVGPPIRCGE
jgi:hypothetical protein